jgi:hypothetical protein
MNCIIDGCKNEIDETRAFPDVEIDGRIIPDELNSRRHAAALSQWEQVTVSVSRSALIQVLNGHTCPAHKLTPGSIVMSIGGK